MGPFITIFLCTLFAFFSGSTGSRFATDVPFAVWSGESYLSGKNIPETKTLKSSDVEDFLNVFVSHRLNPEGSLSKYATFELAPEVLVIVLEPKLRSEQLSKYKKSFENLRRLLKEEKSSLYAPFINLEGKFDVSLLIENTKGGVYRFGKDFPPFSVADLEKVITDDKILTNSLTDLIIISPESQQQTTEARLKESDSLIHSIHTVLSKYSTKYACAYVAETYDPSMWYSLYTIESLKRFGLQSNGSVPVPEGVPSPAANSNSTNTTNVSDFKKYFGGWFWELFLVCIIIIPLLFIGVYAINDIQTPIFVDKKKK